MRAFGSLRIAAAVAILFLSLAECKPSTKWNPAGDYVDDGNPAYDDDSATGGDDEDVQPDPESPPLRLNTKNMTLTAMVGDTVELPCLVDNADDTVINWLKGKELLYTDEKPMADDYSRKFTRAKNFSLILHSVTEKDASNEYRCQILDSPPMEVVHKLVVTDKPRELSKGIRVEPKRFVEVNENHSTKLGCVVEIEPKPKIRWTHNGERPQNVVYDADGSHIMINQVTRHHAGKYQCLVVDPISTDKDAAPPHDEIVLIVKYAPVIDVEHETVHTGLGMKSQLTCLVHAHPHGNVTWYSHNKKNNNKIMITERPEKIHFIAEKNRHTLVIEHTAAHDLGEYSCVARNKLGEASRTIELTGTPSRPKFHQFYLSEDESMVDVEWKLESYSPVVEYELQYRPKGEKMWKELNPPVTNGNGNIFTVKHTLHGLQPGPYEARLSAKNEYGWSLPSKVETFREDNMPGEAENVKHPNGSPVTSRPLLALIALLLITMPFYESTYL